MRYATIRTRPSGARDGLPHGPARARRDAAPARRAARGLRRAPPERDPQPGVPEIDRLVEQVRAAGLPVSYRVSPEARALPEGIQLTLFRIVQEALTNTLKHAGPSATAEVELVATEVDVIVSSRGHRASAVGAPGRKRRVGAARHAGASVGLQRHRSKPGRARGRMAGRRPPAVAGARRRTRSPHERIGDDEHSARRRPADAADGLSDGPRRPARSRRRRRGRERPRGDRADGAPRAGRRADGRPHARPDGVQATERIVASGSDSKIIILTTFDLDEYAYGALRAGASGFLLKDAPPPDMLSAIRAVATGDAVVAPSVTRRLLSQFVQHLPDPQHNDRRRRRAFESLTPRERELLVEVARGLSNAEIAERARAIRGDGQDARRADPREARPARPGTDRRVRV